MDFISVTLFEAYGDGVTVADRQKMSDYLLPVEGIKSVSQSHGGKYDWWIDIREDFKPTIVNFKVSHAEANLPQGFVKILNGGL